MICFANGLIFLFFPFVFRSTSVRLFKCALFGAFFAFWWIFCDKCVVLSIFFVILP